MISINQIESCTDLVIEAWSQWGHPVERGLAENIAQQLLLKFPGFNTNLENENDLENLYHIFMSYLAFHVGDKPAESKELQKTPETQTFVFA